jgi:hypothetical protein
MDGFEVRISNGIMGTVYDDVRFDTIIHFVYFRKEIDQSGIADRVFRKYGQTPFIAFIFCERGIEIMIRISKPLDRFNIVVFVIIAKKFLKTENIGIHRVY